MSSSFNINVHSIEYNIIFKKWKWKISCLTLSIKTNSKTLSVMCYVSTWGLMFLQAMHAPKARTRICKHKYII